MAVESQLGKLSAPEGRPGIHLVPLIRERHRAGKARNEGVSAGASWKGSRRKSGAEGVEIAVDLPNWPSSPGP